ncbi:ABC transporter ATP-binding protein [Plantactinospora solaniradicis]|uniref:ABC transporter ATP-binding protein n=1 Tax=Plantactinospora solaniradicis TaxID=1723736 RepID=A0ABW1JZJ1_9ACTN
MSDIVLALENAGRTYPGRPPVESLRGVDLTVRAGELVAVVGPSGSGKTTLLNLAAGLDRATTGSVRLAGQAVEKLSDRRLSGLRAYALGVVFQCQRVAIARALVGRPALILADEPSGNLDSANGAQILTLLRDLHTDGVTLLVITHDATVAAACPRRVHLRDGRIVADTGRTE